MTSVFEFFSLYYFFVSYLFVWPLTMTYAWLPYSVLTWVCMDWWFLYPLYILIVQGTFFIQLSCVFKCCIQFCLWIRLPSSMSAVFKCCCSMTISVRFVNCAIPMLFGLKDSINIVYVFQFSGLCKSFQTLNLGHILWLEQVSSFLAAVIV